MQPEGAHQSARLGPGFGQFFFRLRIDHDAGAGAERRVPILQREGADQDVQIHPAVMAQPAE